jgi:NAD(P)-dependent dehydrogenase (short-subunit alcohol dehydrogenase family)
VASFDVDLPATTTAIHDAQRHNVTNQSERTESKIISLASCSSKSALNMLTNQYAKAYPDIRINAVDLAIRRPT